MKKSKRVLVISDTHCGHEVGLTPPKWNIGFEGDPMVDYRAQLWDNWQDILRRVGKIDVLVCNGDMIDGRGEKAGGTELIVLKRDVQVMLAEQIIKGVKAPKVFITRGTDYHVGNFENWEDILAEKLGNVEKVGDVYNIDVNGLVMNFRHHISTSQTPLGRQTALEREHEWNVDWFVEKDFPLADVIVRSHTHYHKYAGGSSYLAMTTPALQGYGTRYGERRMSGIIDWGVVVFDVESKEQFEWEALIYPFPKTDPSVA